MSHVDNKKWLCHPINLKKVPCHPVDLKKVPCHMFLRPKKSHVALSI